MMASCRASGRSSSTGRPSPWVLLIVALATSCSPGAEPDQQAPALGPGRAVDGDAYVRVDAEGSRRIGPAEVEPGYLVNLPDGWVEEALGQGEELRLRGGGSVITVQRLVPGARLTPEFAHLVVDASRDQGREVEVVGEPEQRPVAGESALVFEQLSRDAPAVLSRFAMFDHHGARFFTSFSTLEPSLDPHVDIFEEVLGSWAWIEG